MTDKQVLKAFEEILKNQNNKLSLIEQAVCADALDLISRQKTEIDELKRKFDDEKSLRNLYSRKSKYLENALEAEKAEAIKNFAERLKDQNEPWLYIRLEKIDNLVKEMTEADK